MSSDIELVISANLHDWNALGEHWYPGMPLDRLHWNHTYWCYHAVIFQWQSRAHLHNWNTLEDHWNYQYIGMPLELHWLVLSSSAVPVEIQRYLHIGTHRETTGTPLGAHWNHTGYLHFFLQWLSSVHRGISSRHIGLPLDCYWIITE